jgi:hypothetical protein
MTNVRDREYLVCSYQRNPGKAGVRRFGHDFQSGSGITVENGCYLSGNSRLTIFHPIGGIVPSEIVGGFTPDISEYAQFNWYEYIWFYDPKDKDSLIPSSFHFNSPPAPALRVQMNTSITPSHQAVPVRYYAFACKQQWRANTAKC